jgi:hypothetical protein
VTSQRAERRSKHEALVIAPKEGLKTSVRAMTARCPPAQNTAWNVIMPPEPAFFVGRS